jgi:regulatory protein spx
MVVLYTTPGCPDCAAVKRYLEEKGIEYEERDVSKNPDWIDEMKKVAGVRIAPVTVIGEEAFYGTFADQRPKLERALKIDGGG